jgi:hypothetical protein
MTRVKLTTLIGCIVLLSLSAGVAQTTTRTGTVTAVDAQKPSIEVQLPETLKVEGTDAVGMLNKIAVGDRVAVTTSDKATTSAVAIAKADPVVAIGHGERLVAGLLALVLVVILAVLASGGRPASFVLGADNRYSNSKIQLVLWSGTLFIVYLTTVFLRGYEGWDAGWPTCLGGVEIPGNLLALSGLSALTFAGAKAVTSQKDAAAKQQNAVITQKNVEIAQQNIQNALQNVAALAAPLLPAVPEKTADTQPAFTDLFQDDHDAVDLGDTQMFLITVTAVVIFALRAYGSLHQLSLGASMTLPDVDTTLLATFGLGQGAYLAKKAASSPGNG